MVTKVWKCKKCNIFFEPKLPSLKCPKCLGNTTLPAKEYEPNQHALWEPTSAEKVNCPQCNELMANGYLVETNSPFDLTTLGEGIYWTTSGGILGTRISLKSHICPNCGNLMLRVRYKDRDLPRLQLIRDKQQE